MDKTQKKVKKQKYQMLETLGTGAFGTAYMARGEEDGSLVAIKKIDLSAMNTDQKKEAQREVKLLKKMQDPNIVKFRDVYRTAKG